MKAVVAIIFCAIIFTATSCRMGKGCPTNGKNIGAERVMGGDEKTMKALRKAKKFKA